MIRQFTLLFETSELKALGISTTSDLRQEICQHFLSVLAGRMNSDVPSGQPGCQGASSRGAALPQGRRFVRIVK